MHTHDAEAAGIPIIGKKQVRMLPPAIVPAPENDPGPDYAIPQFAVIVMNEDVINQIAEACLQKLIAYNQAEQELAHGDP